MMVCAIERAIILIYLNKSEMVHGAKNKFISTVSRKYPMPLVIKLKRYVNRPFKKVALTRLNVFKRDGFTCQYCQGKDQLTLDHVIPKSRGGKATWNNLVTACVRCNSKKGDCVPSEIKMKLHNLPFRPSYVSFIANFSGFMCDEWLPYLKTK